MKNHRHRILLVEDEKKLQKIIKLNLEAEGYFVDALNKAPNILEILKVYPYDLIILDLMLPDKDGLEICEIIRTQNIDVKILMLSARSSSTERALGLKKGSDDYMVKPFELDELLFRIKKLLKTNVVYNQNECIEFYGNVLNINTLEVINFKKERIKLSKKEMLFLKLLITNPNVIQYREKILSQIWEYNYLSKNRTIDNCILKFRRHFEIEPSFPQHFISKRGVGFLFK